MYTHICKRSPDIKQVSIQGQIQKYRTYLFLQKKKGCQLGVLPPPTSNFDPLSPIPCFYGKTQTNLVKDFYPIAIILVTHVGLYNTN